MEQLIQHLRDNGKLRVVRKGTNILFQGEIPRKAFIVRDGIVRSYMITSSGEERTVSLHGKGEIIPLSWALGSTPNSLFYYEAFVDARLLSFSKDELTTSLALQPDMYPEILRAVANQHTALLLRVAGLEQSRAIEKIGFTLYYLLFRHGVEKADGYVMINVKLSQSMFASLVGLTRESTAKNLKIFKEKNIITYASSCYTVHRQRLENFLGEDAFRDASF